MNVKVTGRHVEVTDEVEQYILEKTSKLPRFYDRIHGIEVVLDHESEQFTAEMIVHADQKHTFVASETGPDTFGLIDVIVERVGRQLTRHKEKSRNHKHDGKGEVAPES